MTSCRGHSPKTVLQKFFAACDAREMDLRSCARIGACVPTAPAQTSASSICSRSSALPASSACDQTAHPEIRTEGHEELDKGVVAHVRERLERDQEAKARAATYSRLDDTHEVVHEARVDAYDEENSDEKEEELAAKFAFGEFASTAERRRGRWRWRRKIGRAHV